MRRIGLLRTTALRLTVMHAVLFGLLVSIALAYIYLSTRNQIEEQIDTRLRLDSDVLINLYRSGTFPDLVNALKRRNQIDNYGRYYFLSGSDQPIPSASTAWPLRVSIIRNHFTARLADFIGLPEDSVRANIPVRVVETQLAEGIKLSVGYEIADEAALLENNFFLVIGASVLTLLFALVGGGLVAYSVQRRVEVVSMTANEIMQGDLTQRLPIKGRNDEFDALANRLNEMLARIEQLVNSMQQVTNNVAHDLRSPLNRLRNKLEVTLLEQRDPQEYRTTMRQAIEDADELIHTFNALLSITRLQSGIEKSHWREVALGDLVAELGELYEPVAEDSNIVLTTQIASNPTVTANRHLIAQALTNLLDNAIKYAGIGSRICLAVESNVGGALLIVSDNGRGIKPEDRQRVLQHFVRLEPERSTPGNGLGLSLVLAICQFHGAHLRLEDNRPGLVAMIQFKC